jgi:N-acyl-D-aspartate/D-glutamate deacylase
MNAAAASPRRIHAARTTAPSANRMSPGFAVALMVLCLGWWAPVEAGTAEARAADAPYDIVLLGGRVMDPESGLDGVRNVGVRDGRIVKVTTEPLAGRRTIDASGLVVAPGFIDLHQHGHSVEDGATKALDGVTTALEMEIGVADVAAFLATKQGRSLIHYGTTASHPAARAAAFGTPVSGAEVVAPAGPATDDAATDARWTVMESRLRAELDAGALGIGMGIQYTPGALRGEVLRTFRVAADRGVPVFTHVRSFGRLEPGSSIEAVSEVIGAAAITGASLQIVHINSSCIADALECLAMVAGARARGLDVTTEAYPYVAGMTDLRSALFNPGWKEKLGVGYDAVQIPDTGEKLRAERFEELRRAKHPVLVLLFVNKPETVDAVIRDPLVMIASDGGGLHPRSAGTYARILGHYVRETGQLTLMDAIRKMSLMPAQRLEKATPEARRKGRVQAGADADIVVFDAKAVADRATYAQPSLPSVGMKYVLVAGTVLVDGGKLVPETFPGMAIRR